MSILDPFGQATFVSLPADFWDRIGCASDPKNYARLSIGELCELYRYWYLTPVHLSVALELGQPWEMRVVLESDRVMDRAITAAAFLTIACERRGLDGGAIRRVQELYQAYLLDELRGSHEGEDPILPRSSYGGSRAQTKKERPLSGQSAKCTGYATNLLPSSLRRHRS